MYIYGAGLAGLLAANIFRKYNPTIIELQDSLPNNHTALLRHREHKISEATAIPFRKVRVMKAINYLGQTYTTPTPKMANLYSLKVTGQYSSRSIGNLDPVDRYIAPPDFIQKLALGCNIEYGMDFRDAQTDGPIISTLPMPVMWSEYAGNTPKPGFKSRNITTLTFDIVGPQTDVYQTVYYPNPELGLYRLSITGNRVIAELMGHADQYSVVIHREASNLRELILHFLELDFGISGAIQHTKLKVNDSKYGKIVDIDNNLRRRFITNLTEDYNIFSLGRFATWRNLLLDDVYDDLMVIQELMEQKGLI